MAVTILSIIQVLSGAVLILFVLGQSCKAFFQEKWGVTKG